MHSGSSVNIEFVVEMTFVNWLHKIYMCESNKQKPRRIQINLVT